MCPGPGGASADFLSKMPEAEMKKGRKRAPRRLRRGVAPDVTAGRRRERGGGWKEKKGRPARGLVSSARRRRLRGRKRKEGGERGREPPGADVSLPRPSFSPDRRPERKEGKKRDMSVARGLRPISLMYRGKRKGGGGGERDPPLKYTKSLFIAVPR